MGPAHFTLGFAVKPIAPRTSLGLLLLAGAFVDLVWAAAVAVGLEHARIVPGITAANPFDLYDYPISHSLVGVLVWAILFAGVYFVWTHDRAAALVLGACVASHWVLDAVSHRPDMPVLPHGPYVGLGLWYSVPATLAVESALVLGPAAVYLRATRGRDRIGRWGLAALVAFFFALVFGYLAPPPPSLSVALAGWILLGLVLVAAHWIDRHRDPLAEPAHRWHP